MAVLYSNPRLNAIPCERMRGCSFADDFRTIATIAENYGTDTGTGNTANRGLTVDGNGYIAYDIVEQGSNFSVVVRFSASAVTSEGILIHNANLTAGVAADGFCIWVDYTGVRANHSNGVSIPTRCSVDISYADGETHTVTYVVDMDGGTHDLYVDALDVDTQATTIDEEIGATNAIDVGGDGTDNFVGTITKVRVFDAILTESEHDTYHADTVTSFFKTPYAAYRCDSFCDDTDGNRIWDRTTSRRDLYKADTATSAKFPTFDADKYVFDLVDDYVSNLPTLPDTYTIGAVRDIPQYPYPYIQQDNDATFTDLITTEGDYWGNLHSMVIHSGVLNQLQLYHDEYQQLYWLWRGGAYGMYHRLITEGTCTLAMFLDQGKNIYCDYSQNLLVGQGHNVTKNGSAGCTFESSDSNIEIPYHSDMPQIQEGTIAVYGTFNSTDYSYHGTMVDRGLNYKFKMGTSGSDITLTFQAITASSLLGLTTTSMGECEHLAVTYKAGHYARFFRNGVYLGDGHAVPIIGTSNTYITIGNKNEKTHRCECPIKQVYIGDRALTDKEILALYAQSREIGATSMETGPRTRNRQQQAGAGALDISIDPGGPFQLLHVDIDFNTAPTTSEDWTIATVNGDADTVTINAFDPSTSSETSFHMVFNQRFENDLTIDVDYPNTDARTITVNTVYQLDESVTPQ